MPEESTTPDLVERTRRSLEAANRRDFDAVMSFYGPDPVWDVSPKGLGLYVGVVAVRGFFEDWIGIARTTNYGEIDAARAAAERLAEERADG
jgi:ketosteroid isomerase-like protein